MKKNYVLEWLDDVISVQLNPEVKGSKNLSKEETNQIKERIAVEERAVLSRLKNRVFNTMDESGSKTLVKKYHDDLVLMITKNYDNLHHSNISLKVSPFALFFITFRRLQSMAFLSLLLLRVTAHQLCHF